MDDKYYGVKIISIDSNYTEDSKVGLKITTDKGDIKLLIDDYQQCCENWDALFLETPDDINKFIGAEILNIKTVEIDNNATCSAYDMVCGGETQIIITTTAGVLQYAVYNEHNGFYAHARILQIFDKTDKKFL